MCIATPAVSILIYAVCSLRICWNVPYRRVNPLLIKLTALIDSDDADEKGVKEPAVIWGNPAGLVRVVCAELVLTCPILTCMCMSLW